MSAQSTKMTTIFKPLALSVITKYNIPRPIIMWIVSSVVVVVLVFVACVIAIDRQKSKLEVIREEEERQLQQERQRELERLHRQKIQQKYRRLKVTREFVIAVAVLLLIGCAVLILYYIVGDDRFYPDLPDAVEEAADDFRLSRYVIVGVFDERHPSRAVDLHITTHGHQGEVIRVSIPNTRSRLFMFPSEWALRSTSNFRQELQDMVSQLGRQPDLASQHARVGILPAYVIIMFHGEGYLQIAVRGPHHTLSIHNRHHRERCQLLSAPHTASYNLHYAAVGPLTRDDVLEIVDYGELMHQVWPTREPGLARRKMKRKMGEAQDGGLPPPSGEGEGEGGRTAGATA